jgi:hypothetical protein
MNIEDATLTVEYRWRRPVVKWIVAVVKWPLQILLLFGHPGRRALMWLNDWFLSVGGLEVRWLGKDWHSILDPAASCASVGAFPAGKMGLPEPIDLSSDRSLWRETTGTPLKDWEEFTKASRKHSRPIGQCDEGETL